MSDVSTTPPIYSHNPSVSLLLCCRAKTQQILCTLLQTLLRLSLALWHRADSTTSISLRTCPNTGF